MQRSHLHADSLGTVAMALSFVLVLLQTGPRVAHSVSVSAGLVMLATTAVLVLLLCALFSRTSRPVTARTA